MHTGGVPLVLIVASGLLWTIVYIDAIRLGFRDRTYAMPLWALALNFAWEVFNSVLGYRHSGVEPQNVINAIWAIFDVFIVITYFRFGYWYVKHNIPYSVFVSWSLVVFVVAAIIEYAFIAEFGLFFGRAYAAFLQNLLMSILFIQMLVDRQSGDGQSMVIAVCKCIGTLCPTVLLGLIGGGGLPGPNSFVLVTGLLCFFFDLVYIFLLNRMLRTGKLFE